MATAICTLHGKMRATRTRQFFWLFSAKNKTSWRCATGGRWCVFAGTKKIARQDQSAWTELAGRGGPTPLL